MGFFTWRAAKGAKREAAAVRADLRKQSPTANTEAAWQARIEAINEAVKTLPQEGKDEINALREVQAAKSNRKKLWSAREFILKQEKIIRKYESKRLYEPVE